MASSADAHRGVCDPILENLKECLLKSDCVVNKGRLPSDCLKNHFDELEDPCKHLRVSLFNCKRAKLDMRKRFRGNSAASSSHTSPFLPQQATVPGEVDSANSSS
ncbi:hypothetical protein DL93DRAFT_2107363 [Clavulina sp. PMI_390]|nr:hypothetical protein DL93DRAFT_2107363 [Clavulina sp. PMI_390]